MLYLSFWEILQGFRNRFTTSLKNISMLIDTRMLILSMLFCIGASPSGKASVFGVDMRRFESYRPNVSLFSLVTFFISSQEDTMSETLSRFFGKQ